MRKIKDNEYIKLEDSLMFAGTIYESFEALEEVMGKLRLERPLFLVYLAKKEFAQAVFRAAGEDENAERTTTSAPPSYIEIFNPHYRNLQ